MEKIIISDPELCAGCKRCEKICSWVHYKVFSKARARVRVVKWETEGVYLPLACFHCETPFCVAVCPVGAIDKDESGVIVIDEERCVNCRLCLNSCPFGMIDFNPVARTVIKCDLCKELGYEPQCVEECPTEALKFVPLDERIGLLKRKTGMEKLKTQMEMVLEKTRMV